MKDFISIGYAIPSNEVLNCNIDKRIALSEADIIIFTPLMNNSLYKTERDKFQGKICYDKNSSFNIKEDFVYWKKELELALKQGKTIFVFLTEKEEFSIHTGEQQTSGTGKNQRITNIVTSYDNYRFLPIKMNVQSNSGNKVYCQSSLFKGFYNAFIKELYFEVCISSENIKEFVFTTKTKDRCLGTYLNVHSGHLVFLPALNVDFDELWGTKGPLKKGLEFGTKLLFNLGTIDKILRSHTEKTPAPEWTTTDTFSLISAEKTKMKIEDNLKKIESIKIENEILKEKLEEEEALKDLLFESGKRLENAVIIALKILGYHAENYDDGVLELDQVITSPEKERFIGECEGKDNKDIDISKFRQLSDAINEDFQRDEVSEEAFGLLFGNPERLIEPNKRKLDFTLKCKSGAKRKQIGLIKTVDLFAVAKYLLENDNEVFKVACRKSIKEQLGQIVLFPTIPTNK